MVTSVYDLIRTFSKEAKLSGDNWPAWRQEFAFMFAELDLFAHILGTDARPTAAGTAQESWDTLDKWSRIALYSTIASASIRASHIKPEGTAGQTSRTIWASLVSEFEGDSRAARMTYKRALYTPVHDPSCPISDYINGVVAASDGLGRLQHSVPKNDVVDSIIMNLHESWTLQRTLLMSHKTEPDLAIVKEQLLRHERDNKLLDAPDEAHAARSGGRSSHRKPPRPARSRSRSPKYDWLNTKGRDACHRCGLPGHRSSRCVSDMPSHIKDQIMDEVRQRSKERRARAHSRSRSRSRSRSPRRPRAHHVWAASDTEASEDEEVGAITAAFQGRSTTFEIDEDGEDGLVTIRPSSTRDRHSGQPSSGERVRLHY